MAKYINKDALVAEIKDLYEDIDKCIGDLVLARSKHDKRGVFNVHWKMETLMVNTQQVLSYILQHLEVKEADLEKEIDHVWDNTSDNFSEDGWKEFEDIAKHFFELGVAVSNKAQKGE